jgi:hypothetical protein
VWSIRYKNQNIYFMLLEQREQLFDAGSLLLSSGSVRAKDKQTARCKRRRVQIKKSNPFLSPSTMLYWVLENGEIYTSARPHENFPLAVDCRQLAVAAAAATNFHAQLLFTPVDVSLKISSIFSSIPFGVSPPSLPSSFPSPPLLVMRIHMIILN